MSASNNFITKPVLSTVCSLLIVIVGLIAIPILPIENLPDIAPPTVKVHATYVGADVNLRRLRLFYLMVISSSGLGGFAIETIRQLQAGATDPAYRHKNSHRGHRR